jgi:UDP-N-acetylmuramoyl-L-alanyl-D-glutamate--2,6-diaminopimelate ligase
MKPFPPPPPWATRLTTVGITGTNGKTTTTMLTAAALGSMAKPVPHISTLGRYLDREPQQLSKGHTGFLELMKRALDAGGRFAAAEITSEVLAHGFARAWPCRVGVFTNLTRDHLDRHKTPEAYLASKAQLFVALPAGGAAVLNGCDPSSALLAEVIPAGVEILRYGHAARGTAHAALDVEAIRVDLDWSGTQVALRWSDAIRERAGSSLPETLRVQAIGDVFAENAMAALLAAIALGAEPAAAAAAIAAAPRPRGRFEVVAEAPHVVVDYAHSPDALARTFAAARQLTRGKLTVVFGAGGNRDRGKRPLMGEAARIADRILITTDNQRDEPAPDIAAAIRAGVGDHPATRIELDRARAITIAVKEAQPDDVIVVAGKGHEGEQIGKGGKSKPFSDIDVGKKAHAQRG